MPPIDDTRARRQATWRAYYHRRKADPEFVARHRAHSNRYYATHREELVAKARAKAAAQTPEQRQERQAYKRRWDAANQERRQRYQRERYLRRRAAA